MPIIACYPGSVGNYVFPFIHSFIFIRTNHSCLLVTQCLTSKCCVRYRHSGLDIGNFYGPGTGQIWLDNLLCDGTETSLDDCDHNGWGTHNCNHNQDVSVECDPPSTTPPAPTTGRQSHWLVSSYLFHCYSIAWDRI